MVRLVEAETKIEPEDWTAEDKTRLPDVVMLPLTRNGVLMTKETAVPKQSV